MQQSDFDKGREAYLFGDDDKIVNANSEFMLGYKDAWHSMEGRKHDKLGENAADKAFDIHCDQIHSEFRRRTSSPVLGLACAVVLATLIMSAFLFHDAEIAEIVRRYV